MGLPNLWMRHLYFLSFRVGVQFPDSERDAVALQKRLLKEAASFIIHDQIPAFVSVVCLGMCVCVVTDGQCTEE